MRGEKLGGTQLVCVRVSDLVTPKVLSRKALCEKCGELIWHAVDSPVEVTRICVQCARVVAMN